LAQQHHHRSGHDAAPDFFGIARASPGRADGVTHRLHRLPRPGGNKLFIRV
jgi:hypothetical protein